MLNLELQIGQTIIDARGNSYTVEPYDRFVSLKEPDKTKKLKELEKEIGKSFVQKQLRKGQKVELEHTKDSGIALSIARDHLLESPYYYLALESMENYLGVE